MQRYPDEYVHPGASFVALGKECSRLLFEVSGLARKSSMEHGQCTVERGNST